MIAAPARIRVICAQSTECPLDTALGAAMTPDTKHFEPNLYTPTDALQFDFRKLPSLRPKRRFIGAVDSRSSMRQGWRRLDGSLRGGPGGGKQGALFKDQLHRLRRFLTFV